MIRKTLSYCDTCGKNKKPIGRDSMDSSYCRHDECDGYLKGNPPGYVWVGESFDMFSQKNTHLNIS